ncbi:hypothetical protein [Streptomyces buecherae]|uniref:hypothetical protein n=1 Tax=Streptomyces buecherae TaxID=2763006 RepID=UPI0037A4E76A
MKDETRRRRRAPRAAVLATALTLALAACGEGAPKESDEKAAHPTAVDPSSTHPPDTAPTATPSREAGQQPRPADERPPTGAASTKIDLESVVLKPGDLAEFQITQLPGGARKGPRRPTPAQPAACQPVENTRLGIHLPAPTATAGRYTVATTGEWRGTGTLVELAVFPTTTQAQGIVTRLREAVRRCAGGYRGGALTFTKTESLRTVEVGEEAVSFHLTGRGIQPAWYTVVRQGPVLARFASSTMGPGGGQAPPPLVVQQMMKLRAAQAS